MTHLFGGDVWPIGWSVGFVERPYREVVAATRAWPRVEVFLDRELLASTLRDRLLALAPLQAPHKREIVLPAGEQWTANIANSLDGGDSVSWVGYLSEVLGCQGVLATHVPRDQYPYPCTQFELLGPEGPPPLRYVRTISAGIFDSGRWSFELSGSEQPFEEADAYRARLKRDRFTRPLLIRYLSALGIHAGSPDFFGSSATLFESQNEYEPRTLTLAEVRAEYGRN